MARRAVMLVSLLLLVAACGEAEPQVATPPSVDDAFVVRIAPHQETALALAREASDSAERPAVRRLAARIARTREELRPAVQERLSGVARDGALADLGVTPAQAAEEISPDGLVGARPVDPAFLTLMRRLNEGALALARAEIDLGRDPAVKDLAQRLAVALAAEQDQIGRQLAALSRAGS